MSNSNKTAQPDHTILPIITERYSPYVFEPKPVEKAKLLSMFEAARWSASSFNEQPWRYVLAERTDEKAFAAALACLMEANQGWAKHAGAIAFGFAKKQFTYNGSPNRVAQHDLGLAGQCLTLQGMQLGVFVHMMAGIESAKIRQTYKVPEDFEPVTAIAIGYPGSPDADYLDADVAKRDAAARERRPLPEFVFGEAWGKPAAATL